MSIQQNQTTEPVNQHPISTGKRALLKAAWVAPVIIAINLPTSSFAANSSGGKVKDKGTGDGCPKEGGLISSIIGFLKGC